ncbi:multiubiquitin domain-containing protein [Lysobacter sp. D1-1-M9]|uniref:multiubiquitin domain-containing protein n=1 Tax=Novilysobacter longmucuonensis TaxID=3098603 RepID=UPI002FC83DFD
MSNDQKHDDAEAIDDQMLDEVIDLADYASRSVKPPKAKGYRIRVNRESFVFELPNPTREQILEKAGLVPVNLWTLRLKLHGGAFDRIEPNEHVDLTQPGAEKFKALPNDQTEG